MSTTKNSSVSVSEKVDDHTLYDNEGQAVKLSTLFGDKLQLIILHNMGKACPSCALWGDEFNGMLKPLERAAAFCVVGPDDPVAQKVYVKERGWQARLYSAQGSTFIRDMGFEDEAGDAEPGVSILEKSSSGDLHRLYKVCVPQDNRCPSVLEVLLELPDVKTSDLAWR